MANSTSIQLMNDGMRHVVFKFEGILDTSDLSSMTVIDPATLSAISGQGQKASKLRIDRITYDVEDLLSVNLVWDGATPARIWELVGRGKVEANKFGGLQNNATTPTGKILATTEGWSAGKILSFSVVIECTKQ